MTTAAKVLRYIAFGLMALFAVLGGAFIIGEAFTDGNPASAALISASWVVPMLALSAYALWRPAPATRVLTVVAAVVAVLVVLDEMLDVVPRDEVGPVGSIAVFAVAVALGFLGLHRPVAAGWLMLLVGTANLAAVVSKVLQPGDGAPAGAALGGSSGAVAVPVLVIGVLFLIAGSLPPRTEGGTSDDTPRTHRTRAAH